VRSIRGPDDVHVLGLENGVEAGGVRVVAIAEQEPQRIQACAEVASEVPCLLHLWVPENPA
jgi:hypothetical protein